MGDEHNDVSERGCRLDEVLGSYLAAAAAGRAPHREELLARHPDLAAELTSFFADQDAVDRWTEPLRPVAQAALTEAVAGALTPPGGECAHAPSGAPLPSLSGYELLEEIGRGGMGVVYKARQKGLGRLVALKMIRAGGLLGEADLRRFRNEAELIAGLDHPHIVPVHEVGDHDGQPFFSLKFMEGGSLARQLARFGQDPRAAARLVAQVARAVHHAHQRGILHRDLKPANILLEWRAGDGSPPVPYVTDFGLARRVEGDNSLTQSGTLVGTPSYMAPEQASGQKGAITTTTDVYGLGAILYALLTGRPPFQAATVLETLEQVKGQEPEPPDKSNPRVDRDLNTICLKCLQKEPDKRYSSAAALAEDLEHYLAGEPIQARRPSLGDRAWKWARRHPTVVGSAVVAVLVALVALTASTILIALAQDETLHQRDIARTEWRRAEGEKQRAKENEARAKENAVKAAAQHKRAEANLQSALRLVQRALPVTERLPAAVRDHEELILLTELSRQAAPVWDTVVADYPDNPNYARQRFISYGRLSELLVMGGRFQEAAKLQRRAVDCVEKWAADFPSDLIVRVVQKPLRAWHYMKLGDVLRATGECADAESAYGRALALYEQLQREMLRGDGWSPSTESLRSIHNSLGALRLEAGRLRESRRAYAKALTLLKGPLPAGDWGDPRWSSQAWELGRSHEGLGELLLASGATKEATDEFREALVARADSSQAVL
jgi:tetratricopeptide (TPR) repeat protein/tRNA A-37 threonylcarbamoyl transferase component Bud32